MRNLTFYLLAFTTTCVSLETLAQTSPQKRTFNKATATAVIIDGRSDGCSIYYPFTPVPENLTVKAEFLNDECSKDNWSGKNKPKEPQLVRIPWKNETRVIPVNSYAPVKYRFFSNGQLDSTVQSEPINLIGVDKDCQGLPVGHETSKWTFTDGEEWFPSQTGSCTWKTPSQISADNTRAKKEEEKRAAAATAVKNARYVRTSRCEHLYTGRAVKFDSPRTTWHDHYLSEGIVTGFSAKRGVASIKERNGDIVEVYCSKIEE